MNALTFIAEMTKALAWPLGLVVLGLIFKSHLRGLLEGVRLRRVQKGEWLADFETVAREVRAELPGQDQVLGQAKGSEISLIEENERLLEIAPTTAVSQAWNQLEDRLTSVASSAGIAQKRLPELLRTLVEKGVIKPSVSDSILGLRNMRNLAVHAPPDRLSTTQAREFLTMAEAITWTLQQSLKEPPAA